MAGYLVGHSCSSAWIPAQWTPKIGSSASASFFARVTNSAPTPVEANVQQTLFQIHRLQAQLDPLTHSDLQWGALKASIVGTYFDVRDGKDDQLRIGFGNDVDTFFSPFAYVAYAAH